MRAEKCLADSHGGHEMSGRATKFTVSIPQGLFRAVERTCKASGKSRSTVIQDALRHWLDPQVQTGSVHKYKAGYHRNPESRREIKAAEAIAVRLLSNENW
jgi:metal-responsive CopG/Arc/MetJ family transcriptional regulator